MQTASQPWRHVVLLGFTVLSCHGTTSTIHVGPTAKPMSARNLATAIAQACTLSPVSRPLGNEGPFPAVFVELAAVARSPATTGPRIGERPAGFFGRSDLRVLRVGNVTTRVGMPVTTAWDEDSSASLPSRAAQSDCSNQGRFDLTITLHEIDFPKRQVKFEIALVPAPPLGTPKDAWYVPDHRQMRTTVVIGDQQPVLLGGESLLQQDAPSILVATPYILSVPEHLNELFQCRIQDAAKLRSEGAQPTER